MSRHGLSKHFAATQTVCVTTVPRTVASQRGCRFANGLRALLLVMLLVAINAPAQDATEELEGFGYLGIGSAMFDVSPVNRALDQFGANDFSDRPLMISLGMHTLVQRLIAESEIQGLFWNSRAATGARTDLWAGTALLNLGVNFTAPGSSWQLYPFAGAGLGIWKISRYPQSTTFTNALTTPPPPAPVWLPTFVADFGGALVLTFKTPGKQSLFSIGVRGGYLYDPTRSDTWAMEGVEVTGGPDPVMSGAYLKVFVGKGYSMCQPEASGSSDY